MKDDNTLPAQQKIQAGSSCCDMLHVDCPNRELFDQIADKWSMMILTVLEEQPSRFNQLKTRLEGISQKSLTQTLRKLERNGLVKREILDTAPIGVRYSVSPLGLTLMPPFRALYEWTSAYLGQVHDARRAYDARRE